MYERGSGRSIEEEGPTELKWWGGLGFVGGFITTGLLAATILGVGLGVQLGSSSRAGGSDVIGLVLGERVYNTNCASCHGPNGEGKVGPALGGGLVVEKYPFISRQIAVIENGRGAMPSFATTLTAEEIEAVALFERDKLGQ